MLNKLVFFVLVAICLSSTNDYSKEYYKKSELIEKFVKFIEWPNKARMYIKTEPFIITIIGENPFEETISKYFSSRKIYDKIILIRYIEHVEEINGSHILFISKSKKKQLTEILKYTHNKPILTLGETKHYSEKGVLINFYTENKEIKFEINETAAKNSGLYINFHLLSAARIINPIKKS
ncbi:MAG: YfiR family protein [Saprospiraceae bacterium]|nr:YfiR family protein [Saprospiraceae bacterium]